MTTSTTAPRSPRRLGRFFVRRLLGRGSFGSVWEVEDPLRSGLRVALKVLSKASTDRGAHDVSREFRLASQVRHPVVLEFLEGGFLKGRRSGTWRPYLLSELVRGTPLRPPWRPRALAPVAEDLLSALDAIHAAGWRHGDIQPGNILVHRGGGRPDVRLLDFGLAEECGRGGIERRTAGTPRYLAPEVLRGDRPDRRADFYALGLILYECLAGAARPQLAEHLLRTRQGLVFEEVCGAALPEVWSRLLRRLLDPDPDARVGSGAEAATLLDERHGVELASVSFFPAAPVPAFEAARPVGQRTILAALDGALEAGPRPRPGLVVVEGARGQGRTRVVREAVARAFAAGMRACGWEALRMEARGAEAAGENGADEAWRRRAFLAPGVGSSGREEGEAGAAERLASAVFDSITSQRTLVAVDDFDRLAPTESLAVRLVLEKVRNVRQRSRLPPGRSVPVLLLTIRSGALRRPGLARWWERLAALAWTARFPLHPWSPEDVSEYLDGALPPRRRLGEIEVALSRDSEGNPGRIRRLLQKLAALGELRLKGGEWVCDRSPARGLPPLPGDRELFERDWGLLDEAGRDLLGVLSVVSPAAEVVPLDVLATSVNVSPRRIASRLRRVESLDSLAPRVVDRGAEGEGWLLGRAQRLWIARAAGPRGRRRWRRLLARSSAPAVERLAQELRLGPVALSRILAAAGAGPGAERLLGRHASDARNPPSDRAVTAGRLGELLHSRGEYRRAERYLLQAGALARDDESRARVVLLRGEALVFQGDPKEAAGLFERVLRDLPAGDPSRGRVLCDLAISKHLTGRPAEALAAAERALEQHPGDLALENLLAVVLMALGGWERAEGVLRSALQRSDGEAPWIRAVLYTNRGLVLRRRGELKQAARLHRRAAAEFERGGLRSQAARAYANLGVGLRRLGEYEAALEAASKSLELHREVGDEQGVAVSETNLAILARELGLPGTAGRRFKAAETAAASATSFGRRVLDHPAAIENRLLLALELDDQPSFEALLERRSQMALDDRARELLPETLLLELRLWIAGRREDLSRLARLLDRRELEEGDSGFLSELAVAGARLSATGPREESEDVERLRGRARRELERLAPSSPRALFYEHLVELEAPRTEAGLERALRYVGSAAYVFPVRDARSRALRALAKRAPDRETRERARGGLRRLVDEILFDLEPAGREAFRRRREFKEVFEMTSGTEANDPALKRARQVVRDVLRFNGEILQETRLESLLRKIVDAAMALTDAERGVLVMREHGRLTVLAGRSGGEDLADPESQISHTLLERVLEEGVSRLTTDAREDLTLKSVASVEELGLRSVLCVPLRARRSRVLGALYLDNPFERAVFDAEDLSLAETFCSQAALAWAAGERRRQTASLLRQLRRANRDLKAELCVSRRDLARRERRSRKELQGLVGDSPGMREVFHLIEVVAPTEIPVLITGESGTGKELVARAVHRLSHRADRPFVAENCGAVPASLLESALFGHVRGAFTGADRDCPGIFQMAEGGTLFLDEIGDMPIELQARLLRVLQEGEVRPLGARQTIRVDVRVVAATNRDVRAAMEKGRFREDLYYRLQGAEIHVPPLRESAGDVPLLVERFLESLSVDGVAKRASMETMDLLARYSWPGNVRELENEVRRLVVLCPGGVIGPEYLSPAIREARVPGAAPPVGGDLRTLRETERHAILEAMERLGGHRVKVAEALGISRSTLYLKLREMGHASAAES